MYSEIDFPLIAASYAAEGNEAYAGGYDGYTFYQTMSWKKGSASTPNAGRGLFTAVLDPPGYVGWVCFRKFNGDYNCKSQYIVAGGLDDKSAAPDLSKDNYDIETGWMCSVNTEISDYNDTAECVYFMPIEADEYPTGQFRWSPFGLGGKAVENIPQVGFGTSSTGNRWYYLGIAEF